MSSFPPLPSRATGHTFRAACTVLAGIAFAQGVAFAVVWRENRQGTVAEKTALDQKFQEKPEIRRVEIKPSLPEGTDPFASALPFEQNSDPAQTDFIPAKESHPEALPPLKQKPSMPAEAVVAKPLAKAALLDIPITDEACLQHLDEGIYLRGRGEMQGALVELRAALALNPDHPQLLYQTARTLDMMIQEQKSMVLWEKLRKLGPGAGNCYQLAVARLKELGGVSAAAGSDEAEEEKAGRFVLGEVTAERLADTVNGEILRFHTSVKRLQTEPVEVGKIWIKLHLFDMVNGRHIARTTAVVKAEALWLDQPVDWADGIEKFDFEYRQPPLSADEIMKLGQRKYYGYAIELRYGDEGQEKFEDMVAEPRELGNFARELPEETGGPAAGESMDVPAAAAIHGQPDGTLFPGDKFDR